MKILVVDDSPFILKIIENGLLARFDCVEIQSVDPLKSGLPDISEAYSYDLIVLDRNLGTAGDGLDWLGDELGRSGMPPVVMISADDSPELHDTAIRLGAVDFIEKNPGLVSRLAHWVNRLRSDMAA